MNYFFVSSQLFSKKIFFLLTLWLISFSCVFSFLFFFFHLIDLCVYLCKFLSSYSLNLFCFSCTSFSNLHLAQFVVFIAFNKCFKSIHCPLGANFIATHKCWNGMQVHIGSLGSAGGTWPGHTGSTSGLGQGGNCALWVCVARGRALGIFSPSGTLTHHTAEGRKNPLFL